MKKIKIGYKLIVGKKEPCFIIVEAVVNHNDNIGLTKKSRCERRNIL